MLCYQFLNETAPLHQCKVKPHGAGMVEVQELIYLQLYKQEENYSGVCLD